MQFRASLIFFFFILISTLLGAQTIEKIEPPNWWAGMQNNKLQLMVYGDNISSLKPKIRYKGVMIGKINKTPNPDYLFVDLVLAPSVQPGEFDIEFKLGKKTVLTHKYELKERIENSAQRKGNDPSDVVYLITPDRFANGDSTNDEVEGLREGYNRELEYGRHGGDLKGIRDHLPYIKDVGFTAIWLNPVLINDQDEWSYHGYATTDYYQVDPRFGTNEEYAALALKAKEMGMGMIMDIIVNHCGSFHWWMDNPPFDNWVNNQGWKSDDEKEYLNTNHRKETLLDPYSSKIDRQIMTEGWFVKAMPDLNQRNAYMSNYLIQNSIWWIEFAHLTGIRQDTYSYPFKEFMQAWTCAIRNEYPDFYIVGEEWIDDPAVISYWQEGKMNADGNISCLPGLMDFPLCFAIHKAFKEEEGWDTGLIRLYQSLSRDFNYPDPSQLIVFPDNHDMKRIFVELGEDMKKYKMALSFLMTTRGIPQLYYGTEIVMNQGKNGSHGLIRSDFPGGWKGDAVSIKDGIGLSDQQSEALTFCKKLLNWRKDNEVIHNGKLTHFIPEEGVYVYFRYDDSDKVMVILNRNTEAYDLKLERFQEQLKGYAKGVDVLTGTSLDLGEAVTLEPNRAYVLELE